MRNDIPNDSANNFGARVRETLMTYLGKQGDPLDRGVTLRDLVESGFASLTNLRFGGGSAPLVAGSAIQSAYVADLTPPPTPTGFAATPAITSIVITCDNPTYTQGNGHLRSRVYGATRASGAAQPVFADAVEITEFAGVTTSYATNPATEWHLWIKWESADGVLSASPAGGTNGLVVTTGQDVATLLTALNGRIAAEQLQTALGTRINLIDAPASTTNSVAWQVAQEAAARATAISAEATARANAIAAEATSRSNAVTNEASARAQAILDEAAARASADSSLQTQINTISAASTGDLSSVLAAIQEEQTARAAADTAEATARSTLATQLRGTYTGTDPAALSTGIVYNERQARITAEGAISSTVSALTATVNANTAAITSESTARANADTALSNSLSALTATVNTNTAAITSEATARASADTALTNTVNSLTSTVNANTAAITSEASTRATADEALSNSINSLTSTVNANTAAITSEATTRANADTALASSITTLQSTVNTNTAAIQTEATTRATADSALASSITTLQSSVTGFEAGVAWNFDSGLEGFTSIYSTLSWVAGSSYIEATTGDPILASPTLSLDGAKNHIIRIRIKRTGGSSWDGGVFYQTAGHGWEETYKAYLPNTTVLNEWRTIECDMSALAVGGNDWITSTITNIRFDFGASTADKFLIDWITVGRVAPQPYTALIQQEATTRTTVDNGLLAQYTVKTDVNGYVSGFGLASTANNATPSSSFAVRADTFYVANPNGPGVAPAMPFIVRATAGTAADGSTIPVGVYITDTFIQNGTITNAKIANAAIDNAKIADAAIATAKIADAAITTAKITDAAITTAKITDAAISSAKIMDAAITNAKIADAAITNAKIGTAAIGLANINTASITNLSALSADMGTLTSGTIRLPATGNSYIIIDGANNRIDVYNAGVLRVRLGNL